MRPPDHDPHDERAFQMTTATADIDRTTSSSAVENKLQSSLHERQRANEAARCPWEDLADFLENAPVAIRSVDPAGTIVWANRAELELLGYRADEYIGRPIAAFHDDPAGLADMRARLARGETLRDYETRLRAKDGTLRHVLVSSNMIVRDGKQISSRCFSRDITDRRRAEDERDRVIAELGRTIRLNDMFAGILGHDLRGPLSTIVMASQVLLGSIDDPKGVRTIQRVLTSAGRMQQMISQLLDFARARVDGGIELDRQTIDVATIARDVIEEVRFARPEWTIDVEIDGDARGDYDGSRLAQVFSNLIGNAAQHGSPEAPLCVRIDGRDAASIRVEIENRGAIAPDVVPVLFSPFRGSRNHTTRSEGLGLGLFITDHIVRAHGGQIAVESADGTTTFRLDLPRHARAASPVATFDPGGRSGELRSHHRDAAGHELAREAARLSEERFRLLVESVKDYAIFMLDAEGRVATWNAGAQRIKGYNAGEIIGRHFSVFYPEHDIRAGKTEHELDAAARDGRFEDEGWRLRKDGSMFWANVIITALRDPGGALVGYAKITQDLTQRRKLEQERVQLAHAQEAARLRDEFLSLASHELKTPLTVLQLQLETLRDRVAGGDRATIAKLDRSRRACARLADLVEALLDVSRIATGRFELNLETGDVADIVSAAVDRMHEAAEAAGCTLSLAADPAVGSWDRSRIDQVITNLVENAIRYAAGTPIEVAVSRDSAAVVIEVRDRGPGLPEGQLARIFERFERAASMRHYGGLGLGLYVVRQVVEAHGGNVTARNAAGGGACFTVRLPLASSGKDLVA
jgi:PAS domain S-box-containing protein